VSSSTERFADVLVVFEGFRQIVWHSLGDGCATPASLWPDDSEQAAIDHHLRMNLPALIILDHNPEPVPLLPVETRALPAALVPLVTPDSDLWELHLPRLQWLPAHLRDRGQEFLETSIAHASTVPALLLPDLLVDTVTQNSVRFAWRPKSSPLPSHRLRTVTRYLFPDTESSPVPGASCVQAHARETVAATTSRESV
jgi:hypothetical protein